MTTEQFGGGRLHDSQTILFQRIGTLSFAERGREQSTREIQFVPETHEFGFVTLESLDCRRIQSAAVVVPITD